MLKKISFFSVILLLPILGLLLSFTLSEEYHFKSITPEPGEELAVFSKVSSGVCGETSSLMDCSTVAESQYAVFYGMPVAILGMLFYAVILILSLWLIFSHENIRPAVIVIFFLGKFYRCCY